MSRTEMSTSNGTTKRTEMSMSRTIARLSTQGGGASSSSGGRCSPVAASSPASSPASALNLSACIPNHHFC